jgi:hypothetical protein
MFLNCMKMAQQVHGRNAGSPGAAKSRNVTTLYVFAILIKLPTALRTAIGQKAQNAQLKALTTIPGCRLLALVFLP